jgi:DNA-directed RNA polymerase specialized sigma24 family protein
VSSDRILAPYAEQAIRAAFDARDFQTAATRALEAFGREILSFLVARLRTASDAEEAFSMFAEDFWKGLPEFGFRCSVRGWMYTLARNAGNRYASSPQRKRSRNLSFAGSESLAVLIDRVRSETQVHKRTDVKDKVRALRERLESDDQMLLILHVDRGLPWRELAMVMDESGEQLHGETLDREATRLRKRFERIKAELKKLAKKEGLLKP